MPTLYVENVPADLYQALRARARTRRRSMAAEVIALLEQSVPTEKELRARRQMIRKLERLQRKGRAAVSGWTSTEEMIREDRGR